MLLKTANFKKFVYFIFAIQGKCFDPSKYIFGNKILNHYDYPNLTLQQNKTNPCSHLVSFNFPVCQMCLLLLPNEQKHCKRMWNLVNYWVLESGIQEKVVFTGSNLSRHWMCYVITGKWKLQNTQQIYITQWLKSSSHS